MQQNSLGQWSILLDLTLGAAASLDGGFVPLNHLERQRLSWYLVRELPSPVLVCGASYAPVGTFEFNVYRRFLFTFVPGYRGQAALNDLAVALLRHPGGLPPRDPPT
jgi:hypothetical protein